VTYVQQVLLLLDSPASPATRPASTRVLTGQVAGLAGLSITDIILAQWLRPVAPSEALDLLHRAMRAVTYRCIAMAIKTASFVGIFVDCFCLLP
jgi:hypothetical protein